MVFQRIEFSTYRKISVTYGWRIRKTSWPLNYGKMIAAFSAGSICWTSETCVFWLHRSIYIYIWILENWHRTNKQTNTIITYFFLELSNLLTPRDHILWYCLNLVKNKNDKNSKNKQTKRKRDVLSYHTNCTLFDI